MIKSFPLNLKSLENRLYPTYYLFKHRIEKAEKSPHFRCFKLGDKGVLEVLTDGEHSGQKFVKEGALFIKNSSVKRYATSELDGFYITHEKNNSLKRSQLKKDDVLFTTIGKYLGVSSIVNANVSNGNINQNVVRMRINKSSTTPQYLSCFLNSKLSRFQIDSLFTGNTYPILTYPKIRSLRIFIPNGNIEPNITKAFIEADRLHIESLKLIEDARQNLLTALNVKYSDIPERPFYSLKYESLHDSDMLTPAYYYPLYTDCVRAIAKKNKTKLLGDIADFKKGSEVGSNNYKRLLESSSTCIPFIRTSDIINYDVDLHGDFYIDKSIYDEIKQNIKPNEVIMTKDGKIGQVAFITEHDKCILSSGFLRIHAHSINPYYLFLVLSLPYVGLYQALQRTVVASTIPHMRESLIHEIIIPIIDKDIHIITNVEKAFKFRDKRKELISGIKATIEQAFDKL